MTRHDGDHAICRPTLRIYKISGRVDEESNVTGLLSVAMSCDRPWVVEWLVSWLVSAHSVSAPGDLGSAFDLISE